MNEPLYRPGLEGVVAGETAICSIEDGLLYRGYTIEELAEQATFEEVAYLILHGELPNTEELAAFRDRLGQAAPLPPALIEALRQLPSETDMMDTMRTGASLLAHWDPDVRDNEPEAELRKAERLLAQLPTVMATRYRLARGKQPVDPDPQLSLAGNTLRMLFDDASPSQVAVEALDKTLILYAEHEFNASTFAARVVCSTRADLHSAITAAIGALKGPLHGGANERVMALLQEVQQADSPAAWVLDKLARKQRIMGFGHRVYKLGDPRAAYLRDHCRRLAEQVGQTEIEDLADAIQEVVHEQKGLQPNLDWPAARLYHYLQLEVPLYTPLFVLSRVTGWSAHVVEERAGGRLIRPRSRYVGPQRRAWVPAADR